MRDSLIEDTITVYHSGNTTSVRIVSWYGKKDAHTEDIFNIGGV